ncbi:MAG TPA: ASKHA domain-containing protein, partial [Candidatus Bathyarchaeia archaeon]|nr:ASKHA domain-containing protein [Candidatus Bathyarchaeia archaeon]
MDKAKVLFQPDGKRSEGQPGESILHLAQRMGLDLNSLCGGLGVCKKCLIVIKEGGSILSPLTDTEARFFSEGEVSEGYRLACRTSILRTGDIVVEIPFESRTGQMKLLASGIEAKVSLNPAVRKALVQLRKPTLKNIEADAENLLATIKEKYGIRFGSLSYEVLKRLPAALREGNWNVSITIRQDEEVIAVEPNDTTARLFGFAVDVGTTKLAGYLVDLSKGKVVASASMINPQVPYGDDILSRITYTNSNPDGLNKLASTVREGIMKLIGDCCAEAGVEKEEVYDVVAVGNTAMHHILFGIDPEYVALAPHPAAIRSSLNVKAREIGLRISEGAYAYSLPLVAGFVGSDAVADGMATEIHMSEEVAMMIDIGTNTEIVLGSKYGLGACSCASGPAFEGARIKNGMRAATGAIESIWIEPDLRIRYKTIDSTAPRGICGSAMVDALAEFLVNGLIDNTGKIRVEKGHPQVRRTDNLSEVVIAEKGETVGGEEITVTQADIREIQLAKAAIYTGASILMKNMRILPEELKRIFIAGAFGNYVNPENARIIGMYPDIALSKVRFVGNSAGSGARMALLSYDIRRMAEIVANK